MRSFMRKLDAGPSAVAGNGLIDRRALLGQGAAIAGALGIAPALATGAAAEPLANAPLADGPWSLEVGTAMRPY